VAKSVPGPGQYAPSPEKNKKRAPTWGYDLNFMKNSDCSFILVWELREE